MKAKKTTRNDEILLTAEGLKKLQEEYSYLTNVKRREIMSRLSSAIEQETSTVGNTAYDQVLEEREMLESRLSELTNMLSLARVTAEAAHSSVVVGAIVTVEVEGDRETYTVVGSAEVDGSVGKISYESPLGGSLLGKTVGETIVIEVPAGMLTYKILDIH